MDSCGPSNPVKAVQSHLNSDKSAFRVAPSRHSSSTQHFRSAKQLHQNDINLANSFATQPAQFENHYQPRLSNDVSNSWSEQFRSQHKQTPNLAPNLTDQQHHVQHNGHSGTGVSFAQSSAPMRTGFIGNQHLQYRASHATRHDPIIADTAKDSRVDEAAAFDRAFDNVEAMLAKSKLQETVQPVQETGDLKHIAKKIIDTTSNAGMSAETTEKFRSSKFMSFMDQLSQGSVDLVGDTFVENETVGTNNASGQSTSFPDSSQQELENDSDSTRFDGHASEDPFAFIEQLARRQSDKIAASDKEHFKLESQGPSATFISSLEQAQQLTGLDIPLSAWEENLEGQA